MSFSQSTGRSGILLCRGRFRRRKLRSKLKISPHFSSHVFFFLSIPAALSHGLASSLYLAFEIPIQIAVQIRWKAVNSSTGVVELQSPRCIIPYYKPSKARNPPVDKQKSEQPETKYSLALYIPQGKQVNPIPRYENQALRPYFLVLPGA